MNISKLAELTQKFYEEALWAYILRKTAAGESYVMPDDEEDEDDSLPSQEEIIRLLESKQAGQVEDAIDNIMSGCENQRFAGRLNTLLNYYDDALNNLNGAISFKGDPSKKDKLIDALDESLELLIKVNELGSGLISDIGDSNEEFWLKSNHYGSAVWLAALEAISSILTTAYKEVTGERDVNNITEVIESLTEGQGLASTYGTGIATQTSGDKRITEKQQEYAAEIEKRQKESRERRKEKVKLIREYGDPSTWSEATIKGIRQTYGDRVAQSFVSGWESLQRLKAKKKADLEKIFADPEKRREYQDKTNERTRKYYDKFKKERLDELERELDSLRSEIFKKDEEIKRNRKNPSKAEALEEEKLEISLKMSDLTREIQKIRAHLGLKQERGSENVTDAATIKGIRYAYEDKASGETIWVDRERLNEIKKVDPSGAAAAEKQTIIEWDAIRQLEGWREHLRHMINLERSELKKVIITALKDAGFEENAREAIDKKLVEFSGMEAGKAKSAPDLGTHAVVVANATAACKAYIKEQLNNQEVPAITALTESFTASFKINAEFRIFIRFTLEEFQDLDTLDYGTPFTEEEVDKLESVRSACEDFLRLLSRYDSSLVPTHKKLFGSCQIRILREFLPRLNNLIAEKKRMLRSKEM